MFVSLDKRKMLAVPTKKLDIAKSSTLFALKYSDVPLQKLYLMDWMMIPAAKEL